MVLGGFRWLLVLVLTYVLSFMIIGNLVLLKLTLWRCPVNQWLGAEGNKLVSRLTLRIFFIRPIISLQMKIVAVADAKRIQWSEMKLMAKSWTLTTRSTHCALSLGHSVDLNTDVLCDTRVLQSLLREEKFLSLGRGVGIIFAECFTAQQKVIISFALCFIWW